MSTEQKNLDGNYTLYVYRMKDAEQTKLVSISEYATAEEAKQIYESEHMETVIEGGSFAINHTWHQTDLRISNCVITVISTVPVNAFELFGIGTARALEVPMDNSYEMYRKVESVNMASVEAAMEADGYTFYKGEFFVGEEEDHGFSRTLIFVSPDRDRIYAYTFTQEPKWGIPYAYKIHNNTEILLEKADVTDYTLGIHFVGFEDGGCILCYGDTFAEIEKYFAE